MQSQIKLLYVVVGLGKTGYSCVAHLVKQGYPVAVVDDREDPPAVDLLATHYPQVPHCFGRFDEALLQRATHLVISPGITIQHGLFAQYVKAGVPISGDIELFAQQVDKPVVAITGTNGKSTVTALLGEMAKAADVNVGVGGNIGTPALDLLVQAHDLYILELSSFQLETTHSLTPAVATILNVAADHLDRYASFADYLTAKRRVYLAAKQTVYCRSDLSTQPPNITTAISFGDNSPDEGQFGILATGGTQYLALGQQRLLATSELRMKGRQNWQNSLAALALGQQLGLPMQAMLAALKQFPGLPHRCQWVGEYQQVNWFNDSKGTNVSACCAAIDGLRSDVAGKIVLIAGGQSKEASFAVLCEPVKQWVRHVIVLGEDAKQLITALDNCVAMTQVDDMQQAVHVARQLAQPGDAVLLSPACASFDMFDNFMHRGEVFTQCVQNSNPLCPKGG